MGFASRLKKRLRKNKLLRVAAAGVTLGGTEVFLGARRGVKFVKKHPELVGLAAGAAIGAPMIGAGLGGFLGGGLGGKGGSSAPSTALPPGDFFPAGEMPAPEASGMDESAAPELGKGIPPIVLVGGAVVLVALLLKKR